MLVVSSRFPLLPRNSRLFSTPWRWRIASHHIPELPGDPISPEYPDTPSVPEYPDAPDLPEFPSSPDLPDTPESPNFPDNPNAPEVGGLSH